MCVIVQSEEVDLVEIIKKKKKPFYFDSNINMYLTQVYLSHILLRCQQRVAVSFSLKSVPTCLT